MSYYDCNYCDDCEFRNACELVDNVNFCEDCKDRWTCTIRYGFCMAGHDIECNNGFEPRWERGHGMRYIDADALVKRLKHSPLFLGTHIQFKDGVINLVERQPTADVVEVRHARWCWETGEKRCTNCGVKCPEDEYNYLHPQYCPNCGARMNGERREE